MKTPENPVNLLYVDQYRVVLATYKSKTHTEVLHLTKELILHHLDIVEQGYEMFGEFKPWYFDRSLFMQMYSHRDFEDGLSWSLVSKSLWSGIIPSSNSCIVPDGYMINHQHYTFKALLKLINTASFQSNIRHDLRLTFIGNQGKRSQHDAA